ncbi:hypothetical protein [Vibrio sp. ABG19]|uniref:hypothetical protein n=1 Tax=Vibrio sp. ABG19 TaxID=2817385 RepID=UPI00249F3C91|nr:hypothetical protein [Vibrio sp. ABG19]WGY45241.1 hypothetical protein J0X00_05985 [Vibrio sp. ABG19]
MKEKIEYQGELVSISQFGKLTGCPLTSLYRAYHKGIRTSEGLIEAVRGWRVEYQGELVAVSHICRIAKSDHRAVKRRLNAGASAEDAVADLKDRRYCQRGTKLTPSQVMYAYTAIFMKEKTQATVGKELGVAQCTISDIWRHKRWDWLTAPLRHHLEAQAKHSD